METYDPKAMMDTILSIKEGVVVEFDRYRRANKNPAFRKELLNEVCQLTDEQRQDIESCTDLLEDLLRISTVSGSS